MPDGRSKVSSGAAGRMSGEEFVRIGTRLFREDAVRWKRRAARLFRRSWNTIWCYTAGRRAIPREIAEELWMWDRLMDEVEAELAARTPEERCRDLERFLDEQRNAPDRKGAIDG